jgi:hypothetical protein
MRELLTREVPRFAFVEVYFSYGMHDEATITYVLR